MRQKSDGTWDAATARADWDRIYSTTDAEIERQEIADLVEAALHLQVGGIPALAARLAQQQAEKGAVRLVLVLAVRHRGELLDALRVERRA